MRAVRGDFRPLPFTVYSGARRRLPVPRGERAVRARLLAGLSTLPPNRCACGLGTNAAQVVSHFFSIFNFEKCQKKWFNFGWFNFLSIILIFRIYIHAIEEES